jgi:hypothetical protein
MPVTERVRHGEIRAAALASAFAVFAIAGCGSGGATPMGGAGDTGGGPSGTAAASAAARPSPVPSVAPSAAPSAGGQTPDGEIPPGREIAEGGGGPTQYTFREEWRRALADARKWRGGAYLITAAGDMVNDEGVPSHWALDFIDRADADAVLKVEVDPWGAVTQTREVTGDGVSSFVGPYTKMIPFGVIDSDEAVAIGTAAMASRYDLARTKDPRIGLGFSSLDGSGPYWTYTLFNEPTAEYVSAHIDALTGEVTPPG